MSKKKKITIGCIVAAVILVIAALLAIFVFHIGGIGEKPYDYDLKDYVTVGDYKGLTYEETKVSVTSAEVQAEIKTRLQNAATTESIETGNVKDGDTINISFVGTIDGKEFDGGTADNQNITIGETSMIDGFTDGLIGKKVGSTVTENLTFPKDYSNTDVAGKDVTFKVTINSRQVKTVPEYDVAFIKKNSDYDNKKDYEASVKKDLLKSKKDEAESTQKNALWQKIVDASKVKKYPKEEYKEELAKIKKQYKEMAESYNAEWEDFLKQYMGMTEKQFNSQAKTYAKSVEKQKMIMYYIADKEDIEVTDSQYDDYLAKLLKDAGMTEKTFKSNYGKTVEEYGEEHDFRSNLLMDKVLDKVKDLGKKKA